MAVTLAIGFEGAQAALDQIALSGTSAPTYSTATPRAGGRKLVCAPASGFSSYFTTPGANNNSWVHFGFRINTLPSVERMVAGFAAGGHIGLTSTGTLKFYDSNGTTVIGTTSALSTGTWYWIGFATGAVTAGACMQIDGSTVITGTKAANGFQTFGLGGTEASAVEVWFDDLVVDDAGFLAPSKVDFAMAISDNTIGGVNAGAGGTSNLFDAVNNTPPTGVASASETNTTNVEFLASVTGNFIVNLETYTTLGVGSASELIALQAVFQHGEDIATGTKNGTFTGISSNPNATNGLTAFAFGADVGAHGTSPTNWTTQFGDMITNSGVLGGATVGSSPQVQIQRVSQSRVGCVDFVAMIVVWTPASSAQTLTVGLLDASPALYAPTLAFPSQSLTVPLLDASPALYAPTLAAKNTLTVPLLDASPALYAPTIMPAQFVTLGLLDAGPSLYAPTLAPKSTLTVPLLDASASLYAPTLTGKNLIDLGLLDASAALYAPVLAPKSTVVLGLLDGAPALFAPTVTPTNTVALTLLDASPALYAPTLTSKNTLSVGLLDGAPALFAPTLMPAQFVTLGLLDASAALYAPTVNQGQTVVLGLLDGAPALFAPTLIQDQFVTVPLLDAGPALYAPLLYQDQFVTLGLLDAGPALYAPTVTKKNSISLGLLDAGNALYAPTLSGGPSVLTLSLLDAGNALYAPIFSQPITGVSGDVLELLPGSQWRERYPWYHRGFPARR